MSGGARGEAASEQYSLGPLLEQSRLDSEGVIEIGISVAGTGGLEEHDLDVFLPSPRIDPGERIELGVFVSSAGEIEETDFSVFYDDADVLDLEEPGAVRRNGGAVADTGDVTAVQAADREPPAESPLEHKPLGGNREGDPAYILELNTRESAPAGKYRLPVVFTYRSEEGIKRVTKRPAIRIRGWRERWQPWLLRLGIAGVALGGLAWWLFAF